MSKKIDDSLETATTAIALPGRDPLPSHGMLPMEGQIVDTQIAELRRRVWGGDSEASQELMPLVSPELRTIAGKYLGTERKDHTLQPTALVNEVYLRIFGAATPNIADKAHFLAIASQMMRRIPVDCARTRSAGKRGGGLHHINLTDNAANRAPPTRRPPPNHHPPPTQSPTPTATYPPHPLPAPHRPLP
jgi:ECF sigma factor